MAKIDRAESVKNLWEKYDKGNADAGAIIRRIRGHITYLKRMIDSPDKINASTVGNIASTYTAARYLITKMFETGKYKELGEKTADFDNVATQVALGYKKVIKLEQYEKAQNAATEVVTEFIGIGQPEAEPVVDITVEKATTTIEESPPETPQPIPEKAERHKGLFYKFIEDLNREV